MSLTLVSLPGYLPLEEQSGKLEHMGALPTKGAGEGSTGTPDSPSLGYPPLLSLFRHFSSACHGYEIHAKLTCLHILEGLM